MANDTLIIVLFVAGFVLFILLVSPLGDKLRNIGKNIASLWKSKKNNERT